MLENLKGGIKNDGWNYEIGLYPAVRLVEMFSLKILLHNIFLFWKVYFKSFTI